MGKWEELGAKQEQMNIPCHQKRPKINDPQAYGIEPKVKNLKFTYSKSVIISWAVFFWWIADHICDKNTDYDLYLDLV